LRNILQNAFPNVPQNDVAEWIISKFGHNYHLIERVVGFIPNVPTSIIGHPKNMWRRDMSEQENLITIYTEVVVSGGVSHKEMVQRGIALLAFVMVMQAVRPIELYTINMLGGNKGCYGTVTKIETKPPNSEYEPAMREMLGMQPEDIFLCGAFLHDKLALTNPVQWVKDMIANNYLLNNDISWYGAAIPLRLRRRAF